MWSRPPPLAYHLSGGSRLALQGRMTVEHHQVRIRVSEEGQPRSGWAYFTHPARCSDVFFVVRKSGGTSQSIGKKWFARVPALLKPALPVLRQVEQVMAYRAAA